MNRTREILTRLSKGKRIPVEDIKYLIEENRKLRRLVYETCVRGNTPWRHDMGESSSRVRGANPASHC